MGVDKDFWVTIFGVGGVGTGLAFLGRFVYSKLGTIITSEDTKKEWLDHYQSELNRQSEAHKGELGYMRDERDSYRLKVSEREQVIDQQWMLISELKQELTEIKNKLTEVTSQNVKIMEQNTTITADNHELNKKYESLRRDYNELLQQRS